MSKLTPSKVAESICVTYKKKYATPVTKNRGPFLVILDNSPPSNTPPKRNHSCPNYEGCLSLVAALDWSSFSCLGCCGEPDVSLVWRAQLKRKDDPLARKFLRESTVGERRKFG